jgi:hypothetical protein
VRKYLTSGGKCSLAPDGVSAGMAPLLPRQPSSPPAGYSFIDQVDHRFVPAHSGGVCLMLPTFQNRMNYFADTVTSSDHLQSSTRIPPSPPRPSSRRLEPSTPAAASFSQYVSALDCSGMSGGVHEAEARKKHLLASNRLLPNKLCGAIAQLNARLYCGRFSRDGTTFAVSRQDDRSVTRHTCAHAIARHAACALNTSVAPQHCTSSPAFPRSISLLSFGGGACGQFRPIKTVQARGTQWTITDVQFTRDGRNFVYSSINPTLHLCNVSAGAEQHVAMNLGDGFGVWSMRISADGTTVVAGTNNAGMVLYDMQRENCIANCSGTLVSCFVLFCGRFFCFVFA